MTLFHLDPLSDPRWDQLARSDPRASAFHAAGWLKALKRTYGYTSVVATTTPPDGPLTNGILFCKVESWLTGKRLVSLPFSDHCEPLSTSTQETLTLMQALSQRRPHWNYVEIRPRWPLSPDAEQVLQRPAMEYVLHTLDLRQGTDEILRSFHKSSVQRKITRAKREQLQCEEGRSKRLIHQFGKLFVEMRRRHRVPPPPIAWFENLSECMGESFKVRVASLDGQPIASIVTLRHRDTMVYKYGCSDPGFSNLGGMPLLLWISILEAKELGLSEFDFGRTDADDSGLLRFKDQWGTARTPLKYWRWPPDQRNVSRPVRKGIATLARTMLARGPVSLFSLAGKHFYRHMG